MRYVIGWLCLILCSCIILGCDSNGLDAFVEDQIENEIEDQSMAAAATQLTNLAREKPRQCGNTYYDAVADLTWNAQLAEAARAHSADMASRNYFDHRNPEGENPGVRIARTGYEARTWGENIAAGYGTIEQTMAGWLDSPGHCKNIMNGNFTEFAVVSAQAPGSAYGIYWTMVLAAR